MKEIGLPDRKHRYYTIKSKKKQSKKSIIGRKNKKIPKNFPKRLPNAKK